MAYEKDPDEIGALWVRTSAAGKEYMTGEINGEKVVLFRAKASEKGPAWRVMKSKPRDGAPAAERESQLPSERLRANDSRRWERETKDDWQL